MSLWEIVPSGRDPPEIVNVVIETPKGSKNKYELAKDFNGIMLDRVLHSSVVFPLAYGLIPRTYFDDGDPLDALVIISEPTFPGCVVEVRPIGLLEMRDEKGRDDKVLTVSAADPRYRNWTDMDDIPEHLLNEIAEFFETYKRLEEGKSTEVLGWKGKEGAIEAIEYSLKFYKDKFI